MISQNAQPLLQPNQMQHPLYVQGPDLVHMGRNITERLDFIYNYDLDSNGLFAFLKKAAKGMNPAYPGPSQSVKLFASSVKLGMPESLLFHEEKSDFKTLNQAYSYVGFELLGSRRFTPTAYTIRNCMGQDPHNETDRQANIGSSLLNW